MENHCVGCRAATPHWSDHFSLAWIATNLALVERRGAGSAERVKERFGVPVWSTCGESRRVRLRRVHSRLPGSPGRDFLCGVHRDALSLARVAGVRATVREALSPHDEDQWRRITLERCEHLCRDRIGARGPTISRADDAV